MANQIPPKRTAKINISQEAFTGMVTIQVEDNLTHQVLLLTPTEARQLAQELAGYNLDETPLSDQESPTMKALTLYNGHALPTINRQKFEAEANLTLQFDFEIRQRLKSTGQTKIVGHL